MSATVAYPPRTVIMMCGDPRLEERDRELFAYYAAIDGIPPFRAILPGACMLYSNGEVLGEVAGTYIDKGARHFHAEEHMGSDPETSGCAAYHRRFEHTQRRFDSVTHDGAVPYPEDIEHRHHFDELTHLPSKLHELARAEQVKITVNTGIFRHCDVGFGELEVISIERELPSMDDVLGRRTLQPAGTRSN